MEKKKSMYNGKTISYGVTNGFSTLITTLASTYWSLFLTSAAQLDTAVMASIVTIAGLADTISVPIVGVIMQKVNFKKGGKFRPWLLIGGIGSAILRWLSFTNLGLSAGGQAIWFGGTYILCYFFFNAAYTAYTSLLPVIAKDPDTRVALGSLRITFNSIGKFLFSLTGVTIIGIFAQYQDDPRGYSGLALIIAVLAIIGFTQLFLTSKEFDVVETQTDASGKAKNQYEASIWEMVKFTITGPFLMYVLGTTCKAAMYFIIVSLSSYYYRYVIGDMAMFTVYLSLSTFLMIGASLITPLVNKIVKGARNTYVTGMALYSAAIGLTYFFGKSAMAFTVLMCLGYIGYTISHSAEIGLYTTVVDYTYWKTGRDLKPFMMSMFSICPKLATTIASAIYGFGLVAIGFDAQNVTESAIAGIKTLICVIPIALGILGIVILMLFPLNNKKVNEIAAELKAREAAK